MDTNSTGEVYGAKVFNWAIIVVAAALLFAVTTNFTPKQAAQASAAPMETVVVTAAPGHAG